MREFDTGGEVPQQQRLHQSLGGTMIREFPVVPDEDGNRRGYRAIDSVIIPGIKNVAVIKGTTDYVLCKKKLVHKDIDRPRLWDAMREHPVVVVQAKRHRLGPRLLGQALFSRRLLEAQGVKVVRTIASCGATDPELEAIANEFGIEVIVDPEAGTGPEPLLLARHPGRDAYLQSLEANGAGVHRGFPKSSASGMQVEALVVRDSMPAGSITGWSDLLGLEVTVVASTDQRVGMYLLGIGVFMRALAERHGAVADALLLAKSGDSALEPLLAGYPSVRLEVLPAA